MRHLLAAGVLFAAAWASAQEAPTVLLQQRGGTFHPPPAQVDPKYLPQGPDGWRPPDEPPPLQLQLALELPLRGDRGAGRALQGSPPASATLQAALYWRPPAVEGFWSRTVFYRYLEGDRRRSWHPDFSYAFGWDDPDGPWGFAYENYTGTRLRGDRVRPNVPQGQWTLARRFALAPAFAPLFLAGDGDAADCAWRGHLTPRYIDAAGASRRWKTSLSLACRYTRPEGWFAHLALHAWPDADRQQPWDPDFTYSLGWQGGGWVLQYQNWSGNRFPGRARGPGEGRLRSGSLLLGRTASW